MSKIQWEYELVERPFCEQLKTMGWQWIEGDTDVPELTERQNFREVLLKDRLAAALRKLNLREGRPWLDEDRISRIIEKLEKAEGHRLMEINESATKLLLKGTEIDGLPDWNFGRNQPVNFIEWDPAKFHLNDFLVINQFKVELTSGRGHVLPDAVLFVNGIPLGVAEFKSPGIENPLQEAINQLLRYSNQRRELWPTLYPDNEGVDRLFHTNQLLIASDFFEARAATIGAPPEAYLEWADTSPVPMSTVAEELGVLERPTEEADAAEALATVGPEKGDRAGIPLFFRRPEQRPEAMRGQEATLRSQQILTAGMLRPSHLLDLIRNFTLFQQVDGKTRKVVARYQQFRAIHKAVRPTDQDLKSRESPTALTQRLLSEHTPDIVMAMLQKYQPAGGKLDGKGVTILPEPDGEAGDTVAMTIVRKEKKPGKHEEIVEKAVTFSENIRFEEFPQLNDSEEILVLVDEAHRSNTRALHRKLRKALPNAAIIGFTGTPIFSKEKKQTREIFGDFIDKYILQEAELDGATVPILYEGRTADGIVKNAPSLDAVFENMFCDYTPEELAVIKAKYATESDVLEAPLLIEQKARDMIRHYASVVLPESFKAQVVATSRQACMTYLEKLDQARNELIAEQEALPAATLALPDDEVDKLDANIRFLARTRPQLPKLRALEIAAVFSGNHNDPESWWDWADKAKQEDYIKRFKRKFATDKTEKTDPLSILVVMNMLLTGFDAPVEQVLYLDRKIVAHDLLQAIARVNRTSGQKKCGYVVDYIGVARHLEQALSNYDGKDVDGALINISAELPKLLDRRARAVAVFTDRGITDLQNQVEACVQLLEQDFCDEPEKERITQQKSLHCPTDLLSTEYRHHFCRARRRAQAKQSSPSAVAAA